MGCCRGTAEGERGGARERGGGERERPCGSRGHTYTRQTCRRVSPQPSTPNPRPQSEARTASSPTPQMRIVWGYNPMYDDRSDFTKSCPLHGDIRDLAGAERAHARDRQVGGSVALRMGGSSSFRALSRRLKFTVRRHKFNEDSLSIFSAREGLADTRQEAHSEQRAGRSLPSVIAGWSSHAGPVTPSRATLAPWRKIIRNNVFINWFQKFNSPTKTVTLKKINDSKQQVDNFVGKSTF